MTLYGYRNGRTLRALWALEEVGRQYEYVEVDLMRGEAREPWFLAINPGGKVPVLIDGDQVITESAAICMHLGDKCPESSLLAEVGSAARTECYMWTSFILTEVDAPLWTIAKHRFVLPKERRVPAVIDTATWELQAAFAVLASKLGGSHYLAGDTFSVADILAGHTLLWAKSARIALDSQKLDDYLQTLLKRPALVRARNKADVATETERDQ